jgi:four helix bundle protein
VEAALGFFFDHGSFARREFMFRFEKLDVWHKGVAYANDVYSATSSFPNDERFGLTSQMRRASVSVSSNVAEGTSRSSDADFARFVEIAYGSLMESVSQSFIANKQGFLAENPFRKLYHDADELSRMLSGLRGKLLGS